MYPRKYLRKVSQTPKPFDIDKLRHFLRPLELKGDDEKKKNKFLHNYVYALGERQREKKERYCYCFFFFFFSPLHLHHVWIAKMKTPIKDLHYKRRIRFYGLDVRRADSLRLWFSGFIKIIITNYALLVPTPGISLETTFCRHYTSRNNFLNVNIFVIASIFPFMFVCEVVMTVYNIHSGFMFILYEK